MSDSIRRRDVSAVDTDLGVSSSVVATSTRGRNALVRSVDDIQRSANQAMTVGAPETLFGKIIDAIAPSGARRERRRGDEDLVRAEVDAQVAIHKQVKAAHMRQIVAFTDAYATSAELEASNEIALRGLEAARCVDAEIDRTGTAFDRAVDQAVLEGAALQSSSARHSAAERLKRRIAARGELEDIVLDGLRDALQRGLGGD